MRQSLSLILGYAELLAAEPEEDARAWLLRELRVAAARLADSLARLDGPGSPEVLAFGPRGEYRVLDLRA